MKSRTKCFGVAPVLLGLGLCFSSTGAFAKINTVSVTGEAAEVPGDRAATELAVKRAARRAAIEEGAGVMVQSNTIVRNFQMVTDEIATHAKGVITDEQWGAMKVKDGVATISLTAKVSPEAVEDAICTVVKANHDPRIALVFVEKFGDESQPWVNVPAQRGRIESLFTGAFIENCFTVVESGVKVTEVSANGDLPQETIEQIVKNANAQYVLLGQGKVVKADKKAVKVLKSTPMNSYSISASVRLINVETNVIDAVATEQQQMLALSADHALKAPASRDGPAKSQLVVDKVMDELFKKIAEKWTKEMVNSSRVLVTVKGIKNFSAAKSFQREVEKAFPGGKADRRSVKKGVGIFDVDVEGGADSFAEKLDGKKIGKQTVVVEEVVPGKVIIQLN